MKVVINGEFGGFGITHSGMLRYFEIAGVEVWPEQGKDFPQFYTYWTVAPDKRPPILDEDFYTLPMDKRMEYNRVYSECSTGERDIARDDPALVLMIEELGEKANGRFAKLKIVEIPDDVDWYIEEYDGSEHVAEKHRTWS